MWLLSRAHLYSTPSNLASFLLYSLQSLQSCSRSYFHQSSITAWEFASASQNLIVISLDRSLSLSPFSVARHIVVLCNDRQGGGGGGGESNGNNDNSNSSGMAEMERKTVDGFHLRV